MRWARRIGSLGAVAAIAVVGGPASLVGATPLPPRAADWTVYGGGPLGTTGAPSVAGPVTTSRRRWTSPVLDGQLYGQPLVAGGRVFVGTEGDTLVALDATDGKVLWSTHVGPPVPASALPCGNIQPQVGITGTPVFDPARREVFAVADELVGGSPAHQLVGLDATTGRVELRRDVDPPGSDPAALLQRTGLNLTAGQVVFGFGGNYGDCGHYHGWVVAVDESSGAATRFEVDAGAGRSRGAIWMGGAAPVVDAAGHVWVSVGNGSVTSSRQPYDHSDSVLELSSHLAVLQFFAPSSWPSDNAHDLDLSAAPALLSDGQVVVAGKSQVAYLLDGAALGGIGGQLARLGLGCGDDVDGGDAVVGDIVYLPCLKGPIAVRVRASPPSLHVLWRAPVGGGPPVVAAGLVWSLGQNGVLEGLAPGTGAVRQQASVGTPANHFPAPAFGDGLLLVAGRDQVIAYSDGGQVVGPIATPSSRVSTTTSPRAPTTVPAATGGGGLPAGAWAGVAVVGVALLGLVGWWLGRRRAWRGE